MQRLIVMYPHPDDPAAFMDDDQKQHLPLAAKMPGILGVSYGQVSPVGPAPAPYFLIAEIDFSDEDALQAALPSEAGAQTAADIPHFPPKGATLLHYPV
ncbi:EthD family reductase [Deinococcus peraridilitoris]|uniref:EthD domain-containing protein n=1 Tax=Deinococcus peraridilitoris (strain DSM 19664 / LMG 22246 / CIP 109416 / KR-200) TaxID=937777 RepID=L0A7Z9_DEIPD|nr:EthD family reductase [Deinococcus peraridilitoris]AFZ69312.1 hypothetical protein Deipe_3898 [Deinococcus peraridilitoris DSM 19664]